MAMSILTCAISLLIFSSPTFGKAFDKENELPGREGKIFETAIVDEIDKIRQYTETTSPRNYKDLNVDYQQRFLTTRRSPTRLSNIEIVNIEASPSQLLQVALCIPHVHEFLQNLDFSHAVHEIFEEENPASGCAAILNVTCQLQSSTLDIHNLSLTLKLTDLSGQLGGINVDAEISDIFAEQLKGFLLLTADVVMWYISKIVPIQVVENDTH